MGILSTNKKIINLGQGYSAGSGISIDDYVISYTGNEGQLYSAGPNIDIYDDQDQLYISGKDWSADIANASSNAYEQATALIPPEFDPSYISGVVDSKLDSTAFSTVSGNYATTSYVDMSDDLTYSRATAWGSQNLAPLNSVADNSAKWNEIEIYEQNSATYLTAHQDISNKLDTTAFSTVSGTFLTAHQVIPSAKWEDASDVVQSNSAQWSENTGDEEVNNAVYNNSANWNDITVYQTNSANYLTAHQVIPSSKWEEASTEYEQNSATYLTAHQDISNKLDTTAFSDVSGTFLTAINIPESATWNDVSTTVQSNSAAWASHQDLSYISGQVDNKLDTTAFSTVSGNFLTAVDLTPYYTTADANTLSSMLSGAIDYVSANAGDEFPASANEAITAYQNASGTYLTAHQPISANEWNSVYETVETNSGSWTGGGGTSLTGDAQGAVDEVYSNSADWNSNYSTVNANSGTWTNGGFTGEVYGISGVSPNVNVYIDQNTLWISAAAGGAGNPEVESYVQTNSASIDEVVSTYETNSGTYLTAHQDLSNYATTGDLNTTSGILSGAIDYVSANAGTSIDTIPVAVISPLVTGFSGESAYLGIESTALNLSSYVPVSSIGYNGGYISTISGNSISSYTGRYAMTANYANTADRAYKDRNYNEITSYYQPKLTIAGDEGTITAINGSAVGANIPTGWELVAGNGISIVDDAENNQTIISAAGSDLSNYYTKTETSSKIELDNAIGNIETLLASL